MISGQAPAQQPAVKPAAAVLPAAPTAARPPARLGPLTLPRGGADLWIPLAAGLALISTGLLRRFPRLWATSVHVLGQDNARGFFTASIACGVLLVAIPGVWVAGTGWTVNSAQARALASWDGNVSRTGGAAVEGQSADERMVLSIPSLGLRRVVAADSTPDDLRSYGVGWIPWTALPAADGVVGIAGHRTTYGAPFFRLDRLSEGDAILIEYRGYRYVYRVERSQTVGPTQVEVLQAAGDQRRVALVTCTPAYSAASRLVVIGRLDAVTAWNNGQ